MRKKKINIFISYCTKDNNKMKAFAKAIDKTKEFRAVIAAKEKTVLKPLSDKVKNGIKKSKYFVPILTKNSIKNQWVNQEIGYVESLKDVICYPIVENCITTKLKGFIHCNIDLPYLFDSNQKDKRKEANAFRKCYKMLLIDLEKPKKKGRKKTKVSKKIIRKSTPKARAAEIKREAEKELILEVIKDDIKKYIPVNFKITGKLKFRLNINLTSKDQDIRVYYQFETDKNEKKWVGFTNIPEQKHILLNENTQSIAADRFEGYSLKQNVLRTIWERFPYLKGKPSRIIRFSFKGHETIKGPIELYYLFSND